MPKISELTELTELTDSDVLPIVDAETELTKKVAVSTMVDKMKEIIRDYTPIYGVKRTLTSTSSAWVRTDDGVGLTANATKDGSAVTNDFDNIYPWSDIITVDYDATNDKVLAEYGDSNFKFDGSNGEVLTYIPEFWVKREQTSTEETIQISAKKFDGATKVEPFYIGRYTTSSGVHSYSGVASTVSQTRATFRTQAKSKGNKWSQLDVLHYCAIQLLYLVEYADGNSQSILGQGNCSTSAQINTGGCDSLGMKSGCLANAGATAVIYRGIENPYGNIWQFVDGLNVVDHQAWVCYSSDNFADDTFADPYVQLGYVNASSNGNPKKMGYDANNQLIGLTAEIGTSVYGDYYWQNSGNRIAFVGGYWNGGSSDGFFYWNLHNDSSDSGAGLGGRLLKEAV